MKEAGQWGILTYALKWEWTEAELEKLDWGSRAYNFPSIFHFPRSQKIQWYIPRCEIALYYTHGGAGSLFGHTRPVPTEHSEIEFQPPGNKYNRARNVSFQSGKSENTRRVLLYYINQACPILFLSTLTLTRLTNFYRTGLIISCTGPGLFVSFVLVMRRSHILSGHIPNK